MKLSQFFAAWAGAIFGIAVYDHKLGPKWRAWLNKVLGNDR